MAFDQTDNYAPVSTIKDLGRTVFGWRVCVQEKP